MAEKEGTPERTAPEKDTGRDSCDCSWRPRAGFPVPLYALGALSSKNRIPSGSCPVHGKN